MPSRGEFNNKMEEANAIHLERYAPLQSPPGPDGRHNNNQDGFDDVAIEDVMYMEDADGETAEPGVNNVPKVETKVRNLYFNDGAKRIDYILAWSIKTKKLEEGKKAREIFEKNLKKEGIEIEYDLRGKEIHFAKLHAPYHVLNRYADILAIRMPMKESLALADLKEKYDDLEHPATSVTLKMWDAVSGVGKRLLKPFQVDETILPKKKKKYTCPYSSDKHYLFETTEDGQLEFSNAVRSRIVDYVLRRKAFKEDTQKAFSFGIKKMLNDGYYAAVYPLHEGHWKPGSFNNNRKILFDHWANWKNVLKYQPLDQIRDYFGEKIGMYFAWLGFYTNMLVPAALVGVFVFVYGLFIMHASTSSKELCNAKNITMCPLCDRQCPYWNVTDACSHQSASRIFDNDATVFFAVFMSFWGTLFLEFWKRRQAATQYKWDLSNFVSEEEPPRPEYLSRLESWTTLKINPITGIKEPYLPFWRRRFPVFLCSYAVMLFLAAVAIGAVVGVIAYRVSFLAALHVLEKRVVTDNSSGTAAIETVTLVYKNASLITTITAALINLLIILLLNIVYGYLAFWLTDWECLRTQTEYDNSITLKLFALQFVNYFSSIVYIAFFKGRFVGRPGKYNTIFGARQEECEPGGCLIELCIQLAIIMVGKQLIQNNFIEIVIPKLIKMLKKKCSKETRAQKLARTPWEKDYKLQEAQNNSLFYEYLEMVLQFGFLTIFCSAFPLAPLFALLNNIIEIRVDANKLITNLRRPMAERAADIGIWYSVLYGISRIAVISNAFIIALSSDFIPRLVYKMRYSPDHSAKGYLEHSLAKFNTSDFSPDHRPDPIYGHVDICRYRDFRNPYDHENKYEYSDVFWHVLAARLAFVCVFENVVIVLTSLVAWLIPDVPTLLKEQIRREAYITNEVILKTELMRAHGEEIDHHKVNAIMSDEETNNYETSMYGSQILLHRQTSI
ncbi:hypothetical protein SNE40_018498 [Patella caerulea]|uniref:Anoctamin n=1 Tax=Patella caerulea TaxID=87958 RepID=A0AAN8J7E5_PATCE